MIGRIISGVNEAKLSLSLPRKCFLIKDILWVIALANNGMANIDNEFVKTKEWVQVMGDGSLFILRHYKKIGVQNVSSKKS